jgi:hypothetical protein
MSREAYPRGLIQKLAEGGENATKALGEFRAAGGHIRTQTWYRMWGEIVNEKSLEQIELGAPLHLRPTVDQLIPMTTVRARGFAQRSQIFGRNSAGEVFTKTIDVRTDTLVSRRNAIHKAIGIAEGIAADAAPDSGSVMTTVIGGVYGGTFELVPR